MIALIIKPAEGKTYADVLGEIWSTESGGNVKTVRKTFVWTKDKAEFDDWTFLVLIQWFIAYSPVNNWLHCVASAHSLQAILVITGVMLVHLLEQEHVAIYIRSVVDRDTAAAEECNLMFSHWEATGRQIPNTHLWEVTNHYLVSIKSWVFN